MDKQNTKKKSNINRWTRYRQKKAEETILARWCQHPNERLPSRKKRKDRTTLITPPTIYHFNVDHEQKVSHQKLRLAVQARPGVLSRKSSQSMSSILSIHLHVRRVLGSTVETIDMFDLLVVVSSESYVPLLCLLEEVRARSSLTRLC